MQDESFKYFTKNVCFVKDLSKKCKFNFSSLKKVQK